MALCKITRNVISSTKCYRENCMKLVFYSTSDKGGCEGGKGGSGSDKGKDDNKKIGCCPPTLYDCRKYGHELPRNDIRPEFDTLCNIPTGVFRCTGGEILGTGGNDSSVCYQNPEYFSFHHMTYYDMHMALRQYRKPSPKTGRKK